jgi:hypothetical protein
MVSLSRPLEHVLHSHSLIARKSSCVSVGRSIPIDCTRPTDELFPLSVEPSTVIFQRRAAAKRICFSFLRKAFSGFGLRPHGPSQLFFLLVTCGSSSAEGQTREAYFSSLSESSRRAAYVKAK